jgi:hypothetical protein
MAPEILATSPAHAAFIYTKMTDVYSFGIVMWELAASKKYMLSMSHARAMSSPYGAERDQMHALLTCLEVPLRPTPLPPAGGLILAEYLQLMQECWATRCALVCSIPPECVEIDRCSLRQEVDDSSRSVNCLSSCFSYEEVAQATRFCRCLFCRPEMRPTFKEAEERLGAMLKKSRG